MTAKPDPNLGMAMLARAGDLAQAMLAKGQTVHVASGVTPNGNPCTVIYGIGWMAEPLKDWGAAFVRKVADMRAEASNN